MAQSEEIERTSIMNKANMHRIINRTKDMFMSKLHKIERGKTHNRKRGNTPKMEQINWTEICMEGPEILN